MGIGLLYEGSAHALTMKILLVICPHVLLSTDSFFVLEFLLLLQGPILPALMSVLQGEIGRRSGGDNVLEREGYAVAAGSALGFVALGELHFMTKIHVVYLELASWQK